MTQKCCVCAVYCTLFTLSVRPMFQSSTFVVNKCLNYVNSAVFRQCMSFTVLPYSMLCQCVSTLHFSLKKEDLKEVVTHKASQLRDYHRRVNNSNTVHSGHDGYGGEVRRAAGAGRGAAAGRHQRVGAAGRGGGGLAARRRLPHPLPGGQDAAARPHRRQEDGRPGARHQDGT